MKIFFVKLLSGIVKFIPERFLQTVYRKLITFRLAKKILFKIASFFIPDRVNMGKYSIFLNQKDLVVSGSIAFGIYEKFEKKVFVGCLKPGMTVADIGANIGFYTLLAAQTANRVVAFEPDPENYRFLSRNITSNGCSNVQIFNLGIGSKKEEKVFFANPNNFGDRRMYKFPESVQRPNIQTISLDEFVKNENMTLDLIKIDIQGAEIEALRGMQTILSQDHLEIFLEFFPAGLEINGENRIELLQTLLNFGFKIWHINSTRDRLEQVLDIAHFSAGFSGVDYANLYCKK